MEDSRIDNRKSKNYRTINMYVRFCEGKTINKTEEAQRFGVDERSIQRDIVQGIEKICENNHIL